MEQNKVLKGQEWGVIEQNKAMGGPGMRGDRTEQGNGWARNEG